MTANCQVSERGLGDCWIGFGLGPPVALLPLVGRKVRKTNYLILTKPSIEVAALFEAAPPPGEDRFSSCRALLALTDRSNVDKGRQCPVKEDLSRGGNIADRWQTQVCHPFVVNALDTCLRDNRHDEGDGQGAALEA